MDCIKGKCAWPETWCDEHHGCYARRNDLQEARDRVVERAKLWNAERKTEFGYWHLMALIDDVNTPLELESQS